MKLSPRWLAAWWQKRRLRLAMYHIAQMSPEFRRDLGLDGATVDDLVAGSDEFTAPGRPCSAVTRR